MWEAERTSLAEFNRVIGERYAKVQVDFNDITKHMIDVFWGLKPQEEPVRPEAAAIQRQRGGDPARQIHTDGRSLPEDPQPAWMGYSVGRWEGDRLAVDTTGFNENSWLDAFGHPRSETMHIRERYRRRDFGHMDLEVTIDDPKYYTRPYLFNTPFEFDSLRRCARVRVRRE